MNSRRDFLKISALASASMMMPNFLSGLGKKTFAADGRKLVVIQLSGGNDGLNTIVPYADDLYYNARPSLSFRENDLIRLDDHFGFNPALESIGGLFDAGEMSVLNSVGYPNPNRSHFRSMDIWHSGSGSDEYWDSGWLGRYLDNSCSGCAQPHKLVEIDDTLSLAVKGRDSKGMATQDPKRLFRATQDPWLRHLAEQRQTSAAQGHAELDYLYKTLTETVHSAEYLHEKSRTFRANNQYPANQFGKKMRLIAELIISGVETSVFYVSLSGFDTHIRQKAA
ncbi:MAG: twin-arginine translocation pathway signal, partial [Bacteroidota bacterium]